MTSIGFGASMAIAENLKSPAVLVASLIAIIAFALVSPVHVSADRKDPVNR